ncbi:antibiotic biosynthesis monooxygenase family protein [Maribellus maritimus]|uniref:antibiotic biosynthesis monooxygenase family protein n=1 Tax=Maribellus maritimus TaxID=2870838 RepID=UPI001EEBB86E|nr:antibiotic biosynthesis monooxygenase [Maribellus maritimus]MCG6185987.1 antibiotic biosynthesis monooxygenase [Maribellus maritimus]
MIAKTPEPPYYAVIFTSLKMKEDSGYAGMAEKMTQLAQKQQGFLGVESARENLGITVSYWEDPESIKKWKQNFEHQEAQQKGKSVWYKSYKTRIAKVERDYEFGK